ncbi:MAG: DNA gyrase subunit A, partial [Bacteroidales bacterium]|nr:DNA gyrase subunit A [Bacteroidales bacterium]
LSKISEEMLRDIEKDTVDMMDNFDATLKEPKVLPTRIPTLLVNGANGIAVGMATNMPTHNLTEVIDGICAYIDNPEIEVAGLMEYIKAPDFPTGGIIYGYDGVRDAYETGRGRVVVRAKAEIESEGQHCNIVVTEIPYGVNKAELIKHIAQLADEKKIEGIANANDESDRTGMRIVVELKKDANANIVLNKLYKMTELQSNFSVNNIALVPIPEAPNALGMPKLLNLKDLVRYFVDHRHEVVIRRTRFDLAEAEKKAHILEGLIIAVDNLDEVIKIIRASRTPADAQRALEARFGIDELQSKAIVDMRLSQLTGLRIEELKQQYEDLMKLIDYYKQILSDDALCMKVVKDELIEVKEKFGDERRTQIDYCGAQLNAEDFIPNDDVVITISHMGYIKRTKLSDYKAQSRGGVGAKGSGTRDNDFIEYMYAAKNHNWLMFFTEQGQAFWMKVYDIPEFAKNQKGRAIQNMLNVSENNRITAFLKVESFADADFNDSHYLVFATERGIVKKTVLAAYSRPRANGINAINLAEDDRVVSVVMTDGKQHIVMANRNGRAITFPETNVRTMGRVATGVRGMRLDADGEDKIIGMVALPYPGAPLTEEGNEAAAEEMQVEEQEMSLENLFDQPEETTAENAAETEEVVVADADNELNESILVVSEKGFGKRSYITGYRITRRGGKGVKTLNLSDKTGKVIAIMTVNDMDDVMIINKSGIAIRLHCQYDPETSQGLRVMGRAAAGVKLIDLTKKNDAIASVCKVVSEQEEENVEAAEDTLPVDNTEASDNNTSESEN